MTSTVEKLKNASAKRKIRKDMCIIFPMIFPEKSSMLENAPFSHAVKTCFGHLFSKMLLFEDLS